MMSSAAVDQQGINERRGGRGAAREMYKSVRSLRCCCHVYVEMVGTVGAGVSSLGSFPANICPRLSWTAGHMHTG